LQHDHREIVAELTREIAAVLDERLGDLLRGAVDVYEQSIVEPLLSVELTGAASLGKPVRVEDDDRVLLEPEMHRGVALPALDPEREARNVDSFGSQPRPHHPGGRMPRRSAGDLAAARIDGQVEKRDELARGDLAEHDLIRGGQEVAGLRVLAGQGAEDEF